MVHIEAQERVFVLPPARPRVIGPGRREQGYREQILRLEAERQRADLERGRLAQELEWSARVERGSVRRSERLEGELRASEEAQKRLLLALGAVQRENELLRQKVAALFPAHEVEEFTELFYGRIQRWRAEEGRP